MIDHYNSQEDFDRHNLLSHSFQNNTSDYDDYRQKLLERVENDNRNGHSSFLDTIEQLRREQRTQLQQVERDYYNQKTASSSNVLDNTQETTVQEKYETRVTKKPPLPKTSKQLPQSVLLTGERAQHHMHRRSMSANIVRRHDDEIAFCPHRTFTENTTTTNDLTTDHIKNQIQSMWNEFELEDYLEQRK